MPLFTPGDIRINRQGRPKLDREVREYIDTHLDRAMRRLWRLTSHNDPYIALGALNLFLKKGLPDLKAIEPAKAPKALALPDGITIEHVTEMAKMRRRLEAQVEAVDVDEPESH